MHTTIKILAVLFLTVLYLPGCSSKDLTAERQEAYLAYQDGNYSMAAEKFEDLVQEIPKDAELWFRLGNSYAKVQSPKKAVEAYENALLRNPELGKAWYNMGMIYLQAALKSFVDMESYVSENDPVGTRGRILRDSIFSLLEEPGKSHDPPD